MISAVLPAYAELHCLSNFSFLRGASSAEELVARASELGYSALAITDECSLAGVVRAHLAAREFALELIVGAEFHLTEGFKIILLATDRGGYGNLSHLITLARRRSEKGTYRIGCDDLKDGVAGCLAIVLPAIQKIPSPSQNKTPSPSQGEDNQPTPTLTLPLKGGGNKKRRASQETPSPLKGEGWDGGAVLGGNLEYAERIRDAFPDAAWIGVELLNGPDDRGKLDKLIELGAATQLPLVACGDVHMHVRSRRPLQDTLTAIRLRTTVGEARHALFPNGERHLRMRVRLAQLYNQALLDQTLRIAERCNFSLDCLRYEYPEEVVPQGFTPAAYLRTITQAGFHWRFGEPYVAGAPPPAVPLHPGGNQGSVQRSEGSAPRNLDQIRELIEHELALIAELRYEPYFLTVYDVVRYARSQGILCQGRGSAANSAVCYCLGVTEVNPSHMDVLFERFISKERNEPPDIDVDFEHQRREEVIQYLYEKYGRDRAAIAATVITYRPRSAVRDVGRALGLDLQQVDRLAKSLGWWDSRKAVPERLAQAGFDPENPQLKRVLALIDTLVGFPRHLSQHTGGFVISQGLLSHLVPIENAAMPARSVIQWDKDDLESLGLLKVDVLALGMLSAIRRALDFVSARHGKPFTMADVPPEDPQVYKMIQQADTVGVFQIESRAQMSMLPRLRPEKFYDLVIEVAIVRPGPIQGGMVHPYLRRKQGLAPVSYPSKAVESVLKRTLGVPIFQEQVMQLAMVAAGFSAGEADKLRRAMAAWRRKGGLEPFEERLISGMLARGYRRDFAEQVFRQILGFGEYGFPESHSVSFALLGYVSSWLKCHEPAAFLAALLNSQPMGFYAPSQLVQDARKHGVEVRGVDVAVSEWDCTLEEQVKTPSLFKGEGWDGGAVAGGGKIPAVRLGLCMVSGLARKAAQALLDARAERPFNSIEDLARRAQLSKAELKPLADAGAFAKLAGHRRDAHWQVAGLETATPLLADAPIDEETAQLTEASEGQNLVADYASLGLTLGRHPLALLRRRLTRMRLATAADLNALPHGRLARTAGIVTGRQRPSTASGIVFVTLEDETGYVNVIVWRDLVERQHRELLASRLMGVYGVLERQGEVVHLLAKRLVDHTALLGRLKTGSRDFH